MKIELKYLTALVAGATLAIFWEEFVEPGLAPAQGADRIELRRDLHDEPGSCADCRGASDESGNSCRPGLQCVRFDRDETDAFDKTYRRVAPLPLMTMNRRIPCATQLS